MDKQPRVTDFVPRRYRVFVLLAALAILFIGALEAIYACIPPAQWLKVGGRPQAFDLAASGSLAAWFSSLLLLAAATVTALVYSIRRFKIDDYKGRYRVWAWVSAACLLLSIDATAGLRHGYQSMMVKLTGRELLAGGAAWWVGTLALVLAFIGVRLILDMRACRGSTALMCLAASLWCVAAAVRLQWISIGTFEDVLIGAGCMLTGHVLLLTGLTLHARYVIFEVEGLLPNSDSERAKQKPKRPRTTKNEVTGETTRIDPPHKGRDKRTDLETPAPAKSVKQSPPPAQASRAADDDEDGDSEEEFGLEGSGRRGSSRAERKRLRRERAQREER